MWFYHAAYQFPIVDRLGTPMGYAYGDVTYEAAERINSGSRMRMLREEVARISNQTFENDPDGARRSGPVVLLSVTLLATPEQRGL